MSINSTTSLLISASIPAGTSNGLSGLLAGGSGDAGATTFGPAALVSVGIPATLDAAASLTAGIAGLAYRRSAAAQTPQQQEAEKKVIQQAFELIDSARAGEARELLAEAVRKTPGRATLIHVQGMAEFAAGEFAQAEKLFRKAGALDSTLGSLSEAENARAMQQDDAAVLARSKRLLAKSDTRSAGLKLIDALTTRSPRNSEALLVRADALREDGNQIKSLVAYARAVSAADDEQLIALKSRFSEMVRRTPNDAFAHNLLGKVQLRLGENEEALQSLQSATRLAFDPTSYQADEALAHVAVGRDQLRRGQIAEAMASFDTADLLATGDPAVKLARAEGLAARAEQRSRFGDSKRAIADFEKAARLVGGLGEEAAALGERIARSSFALGRQLERRRIAAGDDVGQEVVAFQTAYDLDKDNSIYRRKLAETRRIIGDEYKAEGRFADAAASFRRAYELEKNNTQYRDLAIEAYTALGDQKLAQLGYDAAIAAYRQAFSLNGANEITRSKLAGAYNAAGLNARDNDQNRERAAGYFREALFLYPDNTTYQDNYNSVHP